MTFEPAGLQRAWDDIEAGRLWKARDRLGGLLVRYPAEQQVLELLGKVYYQMGDLPAAGRYWFLTGREGPEVDEAFAALKLRYPTRAALGKSLPIRAPIVLFPPSVRKRVEDPSIRSFVNQEAWEQIPEDLEGPYVRPAKRRTRFGSTTTSKFTDMLTQIAAAALIIVIFGSFIVGIGTFIAWFGRWIAFGLAAFFVIALVAAFAGSRRT